MGIGSKLLPEVQNYCRHGAPWQPPAGQVHFSLAGLRLRRSRSPNHCSVLLCPVLQQESNMKFFMKSFRKSLAETGSL